MATPQRTDAQGFESFFRDWYPRLVGLGVAMTGSRAISQEVAQEALLRAHQRWDEVADYDLPGAWVKRVAVNLLVDHLRAAGRERSAMVRLGSDRTTGGASAAEPVLDRWAHLLECLSAQQRVIVTLFYADDQAVGVIADLLGIAPGTVKAQLFKARERLRARLDEQEERA